MVKDEQNRIALLTAERRERILALLQQEGRVFAAELSRVLQVSDDTIRRDLDALAEMGTLQRVHGGALRRLPITEQFDVRQAEKMDAKEAIARATVPLLHAGQVIFLDGGTTSLAIAHQLPPEFNATMITTSPPVANALATYPGVEIILVGGRLYRYAMVAVGAETIARLQTIHADVCVLGVLALHPTLGVSVLDYEEALVKRVMLEIAPLVVAPALGEKLGTVAPFVVAPASAVTHLVTEAAVTNETLIPYRDLGMTVLQG
jgi:DeoR/GlpR family transcriptional regulator of sugar metabolism